MQESKEYTLSLGRNHKVKSRKPYSESDEYDLETDTDNSTGDSGAGVDNFASNGQSVTVADSRGQGEGCAAGAPPNGQVLNNQRLINVNGRQQQQAPRRATFGSPFMNNQQATRPTSNSYQHHNFNT